MYRKLYSEIITSDKVTESNPTKKVENLKENPLLSKLSYCLEKINDDYPIVLCNHARRKDILQIESYRKVRVFTSDEKLVNYFHLEDYVMVTLIKDWDMESIDDLLKRQENIVTLGSTKKLSTVEKLYLLVVSGCYKKSFLAKSFGEDLGITKKLFDENYPSDLDDKEFQLDCDPFVLKSCLNTSPESIILTLIKDLNIRYGLAEMLAIGYYNNVNFFKILAGQVKLDREEAYFLKWKYPKIGHLFVKSTPSEKISAHYYVPKSKEFKITALDALEYKTMSGFKPKICTERQALKFYTLIEGTGEVYKMKKMIPLVDKEKEERNSQLKEVSLIISENNSLKNQCDVFRKEEKDYLNKITTLNLRLAKQKEEFSELKVKQEKSAKDSRDNWMKLSLIEKENKDLKQKIIELEQVQAASTSSNYQADQISKLEEENKILRSQMKDQDNDYSGLKRLFDISAKNLEEVSATANQYYSTLKDKNKEIKNYLTSISKLEEDKSKLMKENFQNNKTIKEFLEMLDSSEQEISVMQSPNHASESAKFLEWSEFAKAFGGKEYFDNKYPYGKERVVAYADLSKKNIFENAWSKGPAHNKVWIYEVKVGNESAVGMGNTSNKARDNAFRKFSESYTAI